ncbi:hypothetical protein AWB81_01845 [Caballeronia arationis]|nr:hypothetical protein AWB81_01845 [Caballeronia arationis]
MAVLEMTRDPEWLLMSSEEKMEASLSEALQFFYTIDELPITTPKVKNYLVFLSDSPIEEPSDYEYGIACVLALHFPNFLLRGISSNSDRERLAEIRERILYPFLEHLYDAEAITSTLAEYVGANFGDVRAQIGVTQFSYDSLSALVKGIFEDTNFKIFRASLQAAMALKPESNKHERDFGGLEEILLERIGNRAEGSQNYPEYLGKLRRAEYLVERSYSNLTLRMALHFRGHEGFSGAVLGGLGLLLLILNQITGASFGLIPSAYAQSGAPPNKVGFTPPLGIPPSFWVWMVVGFYAFLLSVLIVFLWKGYLATPKSEKAASFIDRFGTLALGVFLGKVTGA